MRKEQEIFTQVNAQNVPVSADVLDTLEQEVVNESVFREYIRETLNEMAYIDDYPPGHSAYEKGGSLQTPEVAKHYTDRAERLKKKRSKPPGNWMKVIDVLLAGGYIAAPYPRSSKSYTVYDVQEKLVGKIHQKTFEEFSDSGFLEWDEEMDTYTLSDEGKGYLK